MGVHRPNVYGDTLQWIYVYTHEANLTIISLVDTPVRLVRDGGITEEDQKNMVMDAATGVITTKVKGRFIMQYHNTFSGGTNNEYVLYWNINNANVDNGQTKWTQKGGDNWAISGQTMMELEEGDTIDFEIENKTSAANITLEKFNLTIFKIW